MKYRMVASEFKGWVPGRIDKRIAAACTRDQISEVIRATDRILYDLTYAPFKQPKK